MKVNDVIRVAEKSYRVLAINEESLMVIDCANKSMPVIIPNEDYEILEGPITVQLEELTPARRSVALKRFSMIASVLPVVADKDRRTEMINQAAELFGMSTQSIRAYLRLYLIYQDIAVLAPAELVRHRELSKDEKNMRWGLNKFYYTQNKNSLATAYKMMLNAKYCDAQGKLFEKYPSFCQFEYFYKKHRKLNNYYISRDGIKSYQANNRPLLGEGIQEFAPNIGTAMFDGTICDIYLVNDTGELVGRPLLVTAIDANTSLCLGYALLWEGGIYSLKQLLFNIIEDKEELCSRFGIKIDKDQWNVSALPGVFVTDMGAEYAGNTFEQIAELGVTVINLPAYRPELKGAVEKFFDIIQDLYKDILKGKGVIMPDFQKRGAPDYRKGARLSIEEFEKIIVRCIVFYNSERIVENYPYTEAMLSCDVKPYACSIWNHKLSEPGTNLRYVSKKELMLVLLPRTTGTFTRYGLKVNRLRYHADGFNDEYLRGGDVTVAYNPDDCGYVWMIDKGSKYVRFILIETRFNNMSLEKVNEIKQKQAQLIKNEADENLQAKLELMQFIETVSAKDALQGIKIKGSGKVKTSERKSKHKDIGREIDG